MNEPHQICLIGQVTVDVTLASERTPLKMRLGGIFHAARALWALGIPYSLGYVAPSYLEAAVANFAISHGCREAACIGNVDGCPNVMLIGEPKEAGPQGYEYLLRDDYRCSLMTRSLEKLLSEARPADTIIFSRGIYLQPILRVLRTSRSRVYLEAEGSEYNARAFRTLGRAFEALVLSTSSDPFLGRYGGSFKRFSDEACRKYAKSALLKENRGGARLATRGRRSVIFTPSQIRLIQHSVGVGDCYNAAFVCLRRCHTDRQALAYASSIAAEYACTTYPDDFRAAVQDLVAVPPHVIEALRGVQLPWEMRPEINVYVAAPDFDYIDTSWIRRVAEALRYHNFTPRLPVQENGQACHGMGKPKRQELCGKDMRLLDECQLIVAVLLYDDPGTLIEIGLAIQARKPVILFDPYKRANNLVLTELPTVVTSELDEVVASVFTYGARVVAK